MVQVGLVVVLDVVVAVEEEVAAALVEGSGSGDGRADAILNRQDLADQGVQIQSPSAEERVAASAGVGLVEVGRLLVGKGLCIHQIAVAVADAVELGVVDVDAAAVADDVDAGLVVARQSDRHAATCIEHELQQHDGVLQPVLLLREPCPRLLWLYDGPTIRPYSWIAFHCEESYAWGRAEVHLRWAAGEASDRLILV